MTDLIRRLLLRVNPFDRPRGRHRRDGLPPHLAYGPPMQPEPPLPAHRSPYGLPTPLDGAATVAVRPYLCLHEQRRLRRERPMEVEAA
ncbi:hypothetical protein AB0K92_03510 [Streptomyces sp. NPDC052687]|uniref:hypothetical protein n=1 Tax=Streptomyces sp. NPDC052687 TaxID=3154759 RepID=UPI0034358081